MPHYIYIKEESSGWLRLFNKEISFIEKICFTFVPF